MTGPEMTWIAPVYLRVLVDRAESNPEPPEDAVLTAEALQYAAKALNGEIPAPEPGRSASIAAGAVVRAAREKAGLTQSVLAAKVGVTQTAVSYWEAAKRDIGIADLERIADALGVPAGSLLPVPHRPEAVSPPPVADHGNVLLELMGHRQRAGHMTEVLVAGVLFLRIHSASHGVEHYRPDAVYCFTPLREPERGEQPAAIVAATGLGYCICGPDASGELDERPDCPVHGADAPYDPAASDIGEDPF
jgi:transcriptional regulator with XRE-family HTH domain